MSDATLSNHVKSARKILGDSGELQSTIQTIRGRGYQFIARVDGDPGRAAEGGGSAEAPEPPPVAARLTKLVAPAVAMGIG